MTDAYDAIAKRLNELTPKIDLSKYIAIKDNDGKEEPILRKAKNTRRSQDGRLMIMSVEDTTLDGIFFKPVNPSAAFAPSKHFQGGSEPSGHGVKAYAELLDALNAAKDNSTGERAFAGESDEDRQHWALKLSFKETEGIGLRGIWRLPPIGSAISPPLDRDQQIFHNDMASFSTQLGSSMTIPDYSSVHIALSNEKCNIHIDNAGFVMSVDGNVFLTGGAFRHWADELQLKTKLRDASPGWLQSLINRTSLVYPSASNLYQRAGLSSGQVLSYARKIPLLGQHLGTGKLPGPLGLIPLPGLEFDMLKTERTQLTLHASCSVRDSTNCVVAGNLSGSF